MDFKTYIDIGIVIIYFVISFGFGIFAGKILKSDNKREEGFFLAGRKKLNPKTPNIFLRAIRIREVGNRGLTHKAHSSIHLLFW